MKLIRLVWAEDVWLGVENYISALFLYVGRSAKIDKIERF